MKQEQEGNRGKKQLGTNFNPKNTEQEVRYKRHENAGRSGVGGRGERGEEREELQERKRGPRGRGEIGLGVEPEQGGFFQMPWGNKKKKILMA